MLLVGPVCVGDYPIVRPKAGLVGRGNTGEVFPSGTEVIKRTGEGSEEVIKEVLPLGRGPVEAVTPAMAG